MVRKPSEPVVVIGAGLAGMAAAARLAKAGHRVTVLEAADRLGGAWATRDLDGTTTVDAAPPVFAFPAPWRDLFRKSGRTLEAEFGRRDLELAPAPATRHRFPDGTEVDLPTDRGSQQEVIGRHFDARSATAWRELIDSGAEQWQMLRRLGSESELAGRHQLSKPVRAALRHRRTLADLADTLPDPRLSALVADLGYPHGSQPADTPAFVAVQLYLEQAFGRWTAGSASTMIATLADRLDLRGVQVHLSTPAREIRTDRGRVAGVATEEQEFEAAAVISTCDPFQLYDRLLAAGRRNPERRRLHKLRAALVPRIAVSLTYAPPAISETVTHRDAGGPLVEYTQPVAGGDDRMSTLSITHDYGDPEPDPAAGVGWQGFGSWLDRPPVTTQTRGLFTAGPFSRGGALPCAQILSGALATYGAQSLLDPDRPLKPQ